MTAEYARSAEFLVGTSGFSYPAWRGVFYPEKHPASAMLAFYAGVFGAVEINNTFYRMPSPDLLAGWTQQTPPGFRFALKAPQQITHRLRLKDAAEPAREFIRRSEALGATRGPLLFQLPPHLKADLSRLGDFLTALPGGIEPAFEFRHPSWFQDDTWTLLRAHGAALCIAQTDDLETPLVATAPFGYARLRREEYSTGDLTGWAERLRAVESWQRVYVFLKHDEAGRAPALARAFLDALG
ncbi:MAG TPA: DUF72 domain-containing protein [Candidatus Binatia bacterium]|nr:DUF72 domain-containing protein [Candidatus Binatia bacterium]